MFLPSLLGENFDEVQLQSSPNEDEGDNVFDKTKELFITMQGSQQHFVCDSVYTILKDKL